MYAQAMPSFHPRNAVRIRATQRAGAGYNRRQRGLGDDCVVDARTGLRVCGTQATAANVATGVEAKQTVTGPTCSSGMPRYKGPGYFDWKPPDKDHMRRYAFQYHAGLYDQYGCVPGIADCNSSYNDMLAGPNGEWQVGRLAQDESKCVTTNTTGLVVAGTGTSVPSVVNTPSVAAVSTGNGTVYPAITDGGATTMAWPISSAYAPDASSTATVAKPAGVFDSLSNAWAQLPTVGKVAVGAGSGLLLMKYFKVGRR